VLRSLIVTKKFHNLSTEEIADEFGSIKQQIEELEEKEKELGDELKARIDDVPAIGHKWTVKKSIAKGRTTLDTGAIRELLGDEIKRYEKVGEPSTRLLVKPTMILGESAAD
jgi:seryl-tRNA synthetase